ncbi:MAG: nucleotidyltransferase substrate binding protein [Bdellovibrionales bacterium]|nr:nucleotidyltransferase substrate binding protein [Bdellovibrionales bacterium]
MKDLTPLLNQYKHNLEKALNHLEYSYNKVIQLSTDPKDLDEETLETWESFAARLARVVELFTSKYIQAYVKQNDPGFEGSLRDHVNQAEKLNLVESADQWMSARGLRNITAHEYKEESLKVFFESLLDFAPTALKLRQSLQ